jgi:hypothetical protein
MTRLDMMDDWFLWINAQSELLQSHLYLSFELVAIA